jgi:hypothetical protein
MCLCELGEGEGKENEAKLSLIATGRRKLLCKLGISHIIISIYSLNVTCGNPGGKGGVLGKI